MYLYLKYANLFLNLKWNKNILSFSSPLSIYVYVFNLKGKTNDNSPYFYNVLVWLYTKNCIIIEPPSPNIASLTSLWRGDLANEKHTQKIKDLKFSTCITCGYAHNWSSLLQRNTPGSIDCRPLIDWIRVVFHHQLMCAILLQSDAATATTTTTIITTIRLN